MIAETRTSNMIIGSAGIASSVAIGVLTNQQNLALAVALSSGTYLAKEIPILNRIYQIINAMKPANRNEMDQTSRNCKILGSVFILAAFVLEAVSPINTTVLKANGAFILFVGLL